MSIPLEQPELEQDISLLLRDKYSSQPNAPRTPEIQADIARLADGEPLAYVIGWVPFLGIQIHLDSDPRPLIPRPETEWWTEKLIEHITSAFAGEPCNVLDLCAGSGAIGLAVLQHIPTAHLVFGEISKEHAALIAKNAAANGISSTRYEIYTGNLFEPLGSKQFDIIATNPPYIPTTRELPESVIRHEPKIALYAGTDGLDVIREILTYTRRHLRAHVQKPGELWMECDVSNISEAARLVQEAGCERTTIHEDLYGRARLIVAHFT
jgi:release factor glutamine methyltransferase